MKVKIHPSWKKKLQAEFDSQYFSELADFVKNEYQSKKVYPPPRFIFRAFDSCPFDKVRVVILGQDPYHGPRQANGLCFAVNEGVPLPPSLINIFKEIQDDLGVTVTRRGDLGHWAKQGVLLLNATLTVAASQPGSHQHRGWEMFTDAVIRVLSAESRGIVFLLWGRYAQGKGRIIDAHRHLVLEAAHPSPYSADQGFFGCRHFSKTNQYLESIGQKPIRWA